jgi:hypothetical protein
LTLSTVNILESDEIIVNGRPAIRYVIEKKADITNFPNQPSFRNKKHSLTDIRVSDGSPSMFYVIAKNPELDDEIYMHLLETLSLQN